jgi:hypothetical protein
MQNQSSQSAVHNCAAILLSALVSIGCGSDQTPASIDQLVTEMNQRIEAIMRAERENGVLPRFNQAKTVACVAGEFRVHEDIPEALKQGIFARPGSYPALLRFANATEWDDSKKDLRGLSIRLSGVPGEVLWGEPGKQDFLLNSYPALFVATPEEFLAFIRARQQDRKWAFFLDPFDAHLKSLWTVIKARKHTLSPLDIRYWGTVPFGLGPDQAVKYSATPCSETTTDQAVEPGENQLRAALKAHLQRSEGCFDFGVQRQIDARRMPIEDASVVWDEQASPFLSVATIRIQDQPFDSAQALAACERSRFNPWQALPAHRPLGRMNEVRRQVYAHAAEIRNRE